MRSSIQGKEGGRALTLRYPPPSLWLLRGAPLRHANRVGSIDYVNTLRERGRLFYMYAREALERGHYDLALFYAEQAAQLRAKALILRVAGFVPRSHSVRELLGLLSKFLDALGRGDLSEAVRRVAAECRDALKTLDEAYVASRYLPKTYEREDAERAISALDPVLRVLEDVERSLFG